MFRLLHSDCEHHSQSTTGLVVKQATLWDVGGSFQLARMYNEARILDHLSSAQRVVKLVGLGSALSDLGDPYLYLILPEYRTSLAVWRSE